MPLVKNLENKICAALDPEVDGLLTKGWRILDEAEEAAHRAELRLKPELTSAAAQESARVAAGLYDTLNAPAAEPAAEAAAKDGSND